MINRPTVILKCDPKFTIVNYVSTMLGAALLSYTIYCHHSGIDYRYEFFYLVSITLLLGGASQVFFCHTLEFSLSPERIIYRAYFRTMNIEKAQITQMIWGDKIGIRKTPGIQLVSGDAVLAIPFYGFTDSDIKIVIDYIKTNYSEIIQEGWENISDFYSKIVPRKLPDADEKPALIPAIATFEIAALSAITTYSFLNRPTLSEFSYPIVAFGGVVIPIIFLRDTFIFSGARKLGKTLFPRHIPSKNRIAFAFAQTIALGASVVAMAMLDLWTGIMLLIVCATFCVWLIESYKYGDVKEEEEG